MFFGEIQFSVYHANCNVIQLGNVIKQTDFKTKGYYFLCEVVSKRLSLAKIKEVDNYNHRNTFSILRIKI